MSVWLGFVINKRCCGCKLTSISSVWLGFVITGHGTISTMTACFWLWLLRACPLQICGRVFTYEKRKKTKQRERKEKLWFIYFKNSFNYIKDINILFARYGILMDVRHDPAPNYICLYFVVVSLLSHNKKRKKKDWVTLSHSRLGLLKDYCYQSRLYLFYFFGRRSYPNSWPTRPLDHAYELSGSKVCLNLEYTCL